MKTREENKIEVLMNRLNELEQEMSFWKFKAERDDLTKLLRREAFLESAKLATAKFGKSYLFLIDLDHFKRLNDTFGHQAGDEALEKVSEVLRSFESEVVKASRLGGEEFGIWVSGLTENEAHRFAETIRLRIAALTFSKGFTVTASIGITAISNIRTGRRKEDFQTVFRVAYQNADKALYTAKERGRNRIAEVLAA
jgi:diguanylate cyclase (GGDEF)-like protein